LFPRWLLSLPNYALYLPARGADLLFGGFPIIGTFAFVDDRETCTDVAFPSARPINTAN
jgi:hypothetical protein